MSDKLPSGFEFDSELNIETEEENVGNNENLISEESKPNPEPETDGSFFGDSVFSQENVSKTVTEEAVRSISKIIDKVQGNEVDEDVSLVESLTGAGISAGIKIPKGIVTFGTLLYDIFQDEGIPVDETLTAKLNHAFEQTTLGKIEKASEEVAAETAAGKITEAIGQLSFCIFGTLFSLFSI